MKKKAVILLLVSIFFIIGVHFFTKVYPIVASGYKMYQEAIQENSIESIIEEVKEDDNYVTLDEISQEYLAQVLKSEDRRFYYHFGVDPIAITRAMYNNIQAGSFIQGGSTITQQLAKNMYFSFDKKLDRKVAELFVAFKLEKMLTKEEILELYCNIIYFGENCYGLKEATNHYYGVAPIELSTTQVSALVKTIKSPNNYNPNVYKIAGAY